MTLKVSELTIKQDFYLIRFQYGNRWFGIRISDSIVIDYFDSKLTTIEYNVQITDKTWHRLGLSINNNLLTFFMDCNIIRVDTLPKAFSHNSDDRIKLDFGENVDGSGAGFLVCFLFTLVGIK